MEFNVGKCFAMRVGRQRGRSKMDPPMYIQIVLQTPQNIWD